MERLSSLSIRWLACIGLLFAGTLTAEDKPNFDDASIEFFEKEVRPILVARCLACHSGGEKDPKGGLRLDSREFILKGGDTGPAVVFDKPANSLLVSAINYGDIYHMPPKSKLPEPEIDILTKWVERGLPWPKEASSAAGTVKPFDLASRATEHWCWQPLRDHTIPAVAQTTWPITNVDRFIQAKLESKGLKPAAPAEKRTLLRRVYFDLIGLPPSPEEVEAFIADQSAQAFERVVDQLLGSVHFGERWARHWLDLTRYAETRGHEFEPIIPNAWQYRDYVIRSFNADVPYDRFLLEHIAGDLIEPRWRETRPPGLESTSSTPPALPINESLLGTGFWFLGEEVHSPVDIRKDETDRIDNRLDVLSKTFLGLTVACARCHDHKFDAISQRDYYALSGYALSGCYRQVRVDTLQQHQTIAQQLDALRSQTSLATAKSIVTATQPVLGKLDRYLVAAVREMENQESAIASASVELTQSTVDSERIDRLAKENSLDAALLGRWLKEINLAKNDKQHPMNSLLMTQAVTNPSSGDNSPEAATAAVVSGSARNLPGLVVDFGESDLVSSMQDGVSFGLRPVQRGQFVVSSADGSSPFRIVIIGGWERDLFWKGISLSPGTQVDGSRFSAWKPYGRKVRTPEFALSSNRLWYLVRGSVGVYAAVNSHLIVEGPLHGSLLVEYKQNDDQWHWVAHGLDLYKGHRLHVEFSPLDDSKCEIAMVVQSDQQPQLPIVGWQQLANQVTHADGIEQRAAIYQQAFQNAVKAFLTTEINGKLRPHFRDGESATEPVFDAGTARTAQPELADWLVKHLNLFSVSDLTLPTDSLANAEAELAKQVRWDSSLAPAMMDSNGVDEYLLIRGNSNTPKEIVPRRFLEAFDRAKQNTIEQTSFNKNSIHAQPDQHAASGRLDLARKMLESPAASRVAVNRIWHHLFGRGIVPTVDNMGVLGLPPSHPELLDHLAIQFVGNGWSTKAMIRALVLSRTYQMSSHPTDEDSRDPDNTCWHRMPIKRLEGEVIRDSLLAVSGRLDRTSFGPSVPIHLTEFMQGRGRPGASGPLDGDGRRSIYISVRRNFLSPMMLAFDTPNPFSTVGRRTVSNVPAQALILMNDPLVIEQARRWADLILSDAVQTTERRIDRMYLMAFARFPSPAETKDAVSFLNAQGVENSETQKEAWQNLCHVMFNVKEFIFVE